MYTIGLISQDSHTRRLLTFWLEDAGYRVTSFADEAAMLRALRHGEVLDLLLIESRKQKTDSHEFEPMVRAQLNHVPVPIIGLVSDVVGQDAAGSAFDECLVKPIDLYELLMLLRKHLSETIAHANPKSA